MNIAPRLCLPEPCLYDQKQQGRRDTQGLLRFFERLAVFALAFRCLKL